MRWVAVLLAALAASDLDLPVPKPQWAPPATPQASIAPVPQESPLPEPPDPPLYYGEELPGNALVWVLDRSGSMATGVGGPDVSRWDLARTEVIAALQQLTPRHRFGIVAYDHMIEPWAEELRDATPANVALAVAWVRGLYPRGGTDTGSGTVAGLTLRPDRVALLTDGAPSGYPPAVRAIIREGNPRGVPIDVFCIEAEAPEYRAFCRGVAMDSGGRFFEVQ